MRAVHNMSDIDGLIAELQSLHSTIERTERMRPESVSDVASQAAATLILRTHNMTQYSVDDNNNFLDELEKVHHSSALTIPTPSSALLTLKLAMQVARRHSAIVRTPSAATSKFNGSSRNVRFLCTLRRMTGRPCGMTTTASTSRMPSSSSA